MAERTRRMRRTMLEAAGAAGALLQVEMELPAEVRMEGLDEEDRRELMECVRSFSYLLGQSLMNIRAKGELLVKMRAILERNGYRGTWEQFTERVLRISPDTAENWIAFYEFSLQEEALYQELISRPLRATAYFQLGKVFRALPEEGKAALREQLRQMRPEELADLDPQKVRAAAVALEIHTTNISEEAKRLLTERPVELTRTDLRKLQRLNKREQVEAVRLATEHPELGLRESIQVVAQQQRVAARLLPKSPRVEASEQAWSDEGAMLNPVLFTSWREWLGEQPERAIDVALCELPFERGWLSEHGREFFEVLSRRVSAGGICLVTLGQQDLTNLERYLPEQEDGLKVAWVCVLHRTHGNHPRILGLNIISGYVPMVILYRSPYRSERLISDVQSHVDQPPPVSPDWVAFLRQDEGQRRYAYRHDPTAPLGFDGARPEEEGRLKLDTLERCLRYYLEAFMYPGQHCLHLIMDIQRSFGAVARTATLEAALKRRVAKLTTLFNVASAPSSAS